VEIQQVELFNTLMHSLNTIQSAKTQFHVLTANSLTPTALASQIELCDVLLVEIQSISSSLGRRIRRGDATGGLGMAVTQEAGSGYLAIRHDISASRPKCRK
jgi:hypothetical protein